MRQPAALLVLPLAAACCLAALPAQGKLEKPQSKPQKGQPQKADSAKPKAKNKRRGKRRQGGFVGLFISDAKVDGVGVVTIDKVFPGSDAEKLGFKAGDEIISVNGNKIRNGDRLIKALWMQNQQQRRPGRGRGQGRRRAGRRGSNEIIIHRKGKEIAIKAGLAELDQHPKVGEQAPEFKLRGPDGKADRVLSKLIGKKPVILIFGSYT